MPKGKGIRAAKAEETRGALIAAARRLFADKGFHATSTPEVAALAGVTRGALQHHFTRKEDLFRAVFEQVEQDMIVAAQAEEVAEVGERWSGLKANLNAFLEAAATPEVQRILLIDGPAVLGWAEWRKLEAQYGLGLIMQAVEDGMAAGLIRVQPPRLLAHMILAVVDEAALLVANADDPEVVRLEAGAAVQTLLSSLA
ncbi:TetR/AcrR family transcriptional regulator [Novosphingobium sp. KCTC 2891]|uniref:TetR/AcrR family transcriptional regulator n=1 Tax=Novosphingobium sp. KCTC 2891 TaxID=2989730 RepID=UPI0022216AA1|nr:TetR/AcrR family transcriptional regulator [Novosphingobium sp. KCTC 2891]MCW1385073.1 TetR/AcrR family transcriptional regulator [Novosphingobium sp. KCTC 2891]